MFDLDRTVYTTLTSIGYESAYRMTIAVALNSDILAYNGQNQWGL